MQRIYVHHQGKNTTISVDDLLLALLGSKLKLKLSSADGPMQDRFARQAIRSIAAMAPESPEGGLSQYVQRGVTLTVSDPHLCSLLAPSDMQLCQDYSRAVDATLHDFIQSWLKQMDDMAKSLAAIAHKKPRRRPTFIAKNKNPRRRRSEKESVI